MELKDIKGVNRKIIKKLNTNGYENIENLEKLTLEDYVKIGLDKDTAERIIEAIKEEKSNTDDENEEQTDDWLSTQNRYLVSGFKASEYYDDKLEGDKLKEAFKKFKEA